MILDYKYIEQLLDRYFECETTLEEEKILRTFFCQSQLPEGLLQYRDLFAYEQTEPQEDCLGADFDEKMLHIIGNSTKGKPANKVLRLARSVHQGLQPFCRAAAVVAVIITIGSASQALFTDNHETTSIASMRTTNGKNVADMQTAADTLTRDTLQMLR